jgi:iron(III) transport system permease protein
VHHPVRSEAWPCPSTMGVAICAAILSTLVAIPMAWATSRSTIRLRNFVRVMIVAAFATPTFLGALGWIFLAGPGGGVLNEAYSGLVGSQYAPLNIYSLPGVVFVETLYAVPICFVVISAGLSTGSSDAEDAANLLGASTLRTLITVTLPLALPSVLAAFLLVFVESISTYGTPAILGTPARISFLSTEIYDSFQFPPNYPGGSVLAIVLLLITVVAVMVQRLLLGRRGFTTIGSKAGLQRRIDVGRWNYMLLGISLTYILLSVILPYAILIQASLSKAWGRGMSLENFTLSNYYYVLFEYATARAALWNSIKIALITAVAVALLAAAVAYVTERKLVRGSHFLPVLALLPLAIPGVVLGVGMFFAYAGAPFYLFGTLWIMLLAYITRALPLSYVSTRASIKAIQPELEESARSLGATAYRAFGRITLPLMRPGILAAGLLAFVMSLRELGAAVFLYTSDTQVIAVSIVNQSADGKWTYAAVIGLILLLLTFIVAGAAYKILGRNVLITSEPTGGK